MLTSIECVLLTSGDWGLFWASPSYPGSTRSLKLCQVCGSTSWVGSRDFYAHIWELWRHWSHMGCMLDSDWSRQLLLRCDWSGPSWASFTTNQHQRKVLVSTIKWKRHTLKISSWDSNVRTTLCSKIHREHHRKVLVSTFYWNGHILRFYPQTQKLEPPSVA